MVDGRLIKMRQAYPLDLKVEFSKARIRQWYSHWGGKVYVAFSGGKDSTVLLHLVRSMYPSVPAVFCNTGLEFPEIVRFVRQTENVTWVKPKRRFKDIIKEEGYPVVSKLVARQIRDLQNPTQKNENSRRLYLTGVRQDGTETNTWTMKLAKRWRCLIDAPFKVSAKCCDYMKKEPSKRYEKETGRKPYMGTMISDGAGRRGAFIQQGACNAYAVARPQSKPLSYWLTKDIWEYIDGNSLPYCKIYDMGYHNTGCVFCGFGVQMEKNINRFQQLYLTHPKLYKYCMETLGLKEVYDYMGISVDPLPEQEELAL